MVDIRGIMSAVGDFLDQSDEAAAAETARLNRAKIARDAAAKLAKDTNQDVQRRVAAAKTVDMYQQQIDTNPLTIQQKQAKREQEVQITKANKILQKSGFAPAVSPQQAAAALPQKITFGAPAAAVPAAGVAAAPAAAPVHPEMGGDPRSYFTSMGFGINSLARTPAHNAAVGGVKNSMHLTGEAADLSVPKGVDRKQAVAALKQQGFTEVLDEGDHIHVGWRGMHVTPFATAQSMIPATAGALQTGGVATNDPAALAGMMRAPQMIPGVNLPNAPHQEMPAELKPYAQLDKTALLAPMAEALAPVAPDTAHRPWDRVQQMLISAGAAAAGADPSQGMGNFLLRAGTGAGQGFTQERDKQREEDKTYKEQLRQAKIVLAQQGFNIDLKNVDTQNFNMDRVTTNEQNKKNVKFSNMSADDQRNVQEILTNHGVLAQNVGMGNQFRSAQDNVMIQGTQQNTAAINAATGQQLQANELAARTGVHAPIEQMVSSVGVDTANTKNPHLLTARSTAAAILANRPEAAFSSFAEELVQTPGAVQAILAPSADDSPEAAKAKKAAMNEFKRAKKPSDAWGTVAALNTLLQGNPGVALQIAKDFQAQSPSAALILKHAQPSQPAGTGAP
jgi:hypothetical protein